MTMFMHKQPPSLCSQAAPGVNAHRLRGCRPCMHSTCTKALLISWPVTSCCTMSPKCRFGFSIQMVVGWSISQVDSISPWRARNVSWINLVFLWVSDPVLSLINTSWFNFHLIGLHDFRSVFMLNEIEGMFISQDWKPGIHSTPVQQLAASLSIWDLLWLTPLLKRSRKIAAWSFSSPSHGTSHYRRLSPKP